MYQNTEGSKMYHIPNDLRAKKSAEWICKGLEECLAEKPLDKIRVKDICEKYYVSRATFYRLFDSVMDVLAYECDLIRNDTIKAIETLTFKNKNEEVLFCIKRWLKHETIIKTIIDNRLIGVLYDSHMRNAEQLKKLYSLYYKDDGQFHCFVSLLVSLVFTALSVYFQNGTTESVENVFVSVCKNTNIIIGNWGKGIKNKS